MLINLSSQIGIFVMNTCGGNPQKIRSPLFASVSMFATWHVQVESPSLHALLVPTPHHRPLVTVRWGKWLIHRLFIPPLWLTFARPRMRRAHSVQSLAHYWMFVLSFSPHSLADNPVSSYGSQSHDLGLPKPKMILGCAGRELTVHSTRILSARPAEMFLPTVLTVDALASGASSMASSNWRSSASTMSSARTSPEMQGGGSAKAKVRSSSRRWYPHNPCQCHSKLGELGKTSMVLSHRSVGTRMSTTSQTSSNCTSKKLSSWKLTCGKASTVSIPLGDMNIAIVPPRNR